MIKYKVTGGVFSLKIFSLTMAFCLIGCDVQINGNAFPLNGATSIAFTDTDPNGGSLAGDISIGKAADELTVTHYVIYWGSNSSTKLTDSSAPLATLAKTGSNLLSTLIEGTTKPVSATHLIVFTKNIFGEMSNGVSVAIIDKGGDDNSLVDVALPRPLPTAPKHQPLVPSPTSCKAIDYDGDGQLSIEEIRFAEGLVRKSCTNDAPIEGVPNTITDQSTIGGCFFRVGQKYAASASKSTLRECLIDIPASGHPTICSSFPGENYSYCFSPYTGTGTTLDPIRVVSPTPIILKSGLCPGVQACMAYEKVKQFDLDGDGVMTAADISGFNKFATSCEMIMRQMILK